MGERRRRLIQNYEDAKLALLLDEYAEAYGKVSTEQYEKDLAAGRIKELSDQELDAQLNAILQRAEKESTKKYHPLHFKGVLRMTAIVAASIAIFFFLMITVQAAGFDVFGAVGRWTESIFQFESKQNENSAVIEKRIPATEIIKQTLLSQDIPVELSPSWLPEEYLISELSTPSNSDFIGVTVTLENSTDCVLIRIEKKTQGNTSFYWVEKDASEVETLTIEQKTFYIMQNNGEWSAVWQNDSYAIFIFSTNGKEELINILQSIGGTYE